MCRHDWCHYPQVLPRLSIVQMKRKPPRFSWFSGRLHLLAGRPKLSGAAWCSKAHLSHTFLGESSNCCCPFQGLAGKRPQQQQPWRHLTSVSMSSPLQPASSSSSYCRILRQKNRQKGPAKSLASFIIPSWFKWWWNSPGAPPWCEIRWPSQCTRRQWSRTSNPFVSVTKKDWFRAFIVNSDHIREIMSEDIINKCDAVKW